MDSVCFDLEKENQDGCNVNEADVPSSTSKKRKRTKDTKPKVLSCEKTCKPRKKNKTPKKGFTLFITKTLYVIALNCNSDLSMLFVICSAGWSKSHTVSEHNNKLNDSSIYLSFQANAQLKWREAL